MRWRGCGGVQGLHTLAVLEQDAGDKGPRAGLGRVLQHTGHWADDEPGEVGKQRPLGCAGVRGAARMDLKRVLDLVRRQAPRWVGVSDGGAGRLVGQLRCAWRLGQADL